MKGFFGAAPAQAQTYPSRPITLVVPFPPGGSTDAAARHRQAQCRDGGGAGRSRDPEAVYRIGARRRAPARSKPRKGLAAFQKAEIEKWWPIIKAAGIGVQAQ